MQLDLLTTPQRHARLRADDGIRRARRHADQVRHDWTRQAIDTLRAWAVGRGEFLAEHFIAARLIEDPPDPHAWGGVFRDAARSGLIVRAGFARAETSNGSFKPTWRLA